MALLLLLLHAAHAERLPHLLGHRTVEYQHQKPDEGAEQAWEQVKPFTVMGRFGCACVGLNSCKNAITCRSLGFLQGGFGK